MLRLVLIDDHKIILDGIASLIESESSFEILGAFQDPKEALDFLDKHNLDIVLTDLDMQGLNGEDVLQYCKSKFPSVKIIILSMHNEKTVIKHLISLGADGYVVKSAGREEIIQAIRTVASGSKYFSNEVMQSLINDEEKELPQNPALDILTSREIEIIRCIANGMSSKAIGDELHISPRTAETHRNNILKKLDVSGIAGIIRFAFQQRIID